MKIKKIINLSFLIFTNYIDNIKEKSEINAYATFLLNLKSYEKLLDLINNGYQLTYKQSRVLAKHTVEFLFEDSILINEKYKEQHKMLEIFKLQGNHLYFMKNIKNIKNFSFQNSFFYIMGLNAFNTKDNNELTGKNRELLFNALDISTSVINTTKTNNIFKFTKFSDLLIYLPIEFHSIISKKIDINIKEKNSYKLSIFTTYKDILYKRKLNGQETLTSQIERLEQLKVALEYAENLILKNKNPEIKTKHENIVSILQKNNKTNVNLNNQNINFSFFNFESNFQLDKQILTEIKEIQNLYKNINPSDINLEEKMILENVPSLVFKLLDTYETIKDFVPEENKNFIDNLTTLKLTLISIKDNQEKNNINKLENNLQVNLSKKY